MIQAKWAKIGLYFTFEVDPDPEMDPDLHVDPDPRWIRIHVIPILALVDVIPDPDPDPAKNGIVTPLEATSSEPRGVDSESLCWAVPVSSESR